MFDLQGKQNQPEKAKSEFFFDLEIELRDPAKMKEYTHRVEEKIQKIKALMRTGENKDSYANYNILLQGYTGLLKIFSRLQQKKK